MGRLLDHIRLPEWLTGPAIYAGSQVAAIEMLDAETAPAAVIIAVLVIYLRLILPAATVRASITSFGIWRSSDNVCGGRCRDREPPGGISRVPARADLVAHGVRHAHHRGL
jgi:hypothetical protein